MEWFRLGLVGTRRHVSSCAFQEYPIMPKRTAFPFTYASISGLVFSLFLGLSALLPVASHGQQLRRKPSRVPPPNFQPREFDGVFFEDVTGQLVGKPTARSPAGAPPAVTSLPGQVPIATAPGEQGSNLWKERISGQSLEDLVKEGKRRLDGIVTTPAKFSAGGYKEARREFTLLTILFATIEQYPEEVRWKSSASIARSRFGRMAANAKVGTAPAYQEAKLRMEDLNSLLKGTALTDTAPPVEILWGELIDRVPSMQILEWALREQLNPKVASESAFKSQVEEVLTYAELIALIGETMHQPGMADADDEEYKNWTMKMVAEATRIREAVQLDNPTMAREAAGQLDQACNGCHNTFR